jgi:hypothetical protein
MGFVGWDRASGSRGANNPPFAIKLQRMGHPAHPAAFDGHPALAGQRWDCGRFGREDDLFLMKNDYNWKDGSRSLRDDNKKEEVTAKAKAQLLACGSRGGEADFSTARLTDA